MVDSLIDIFDKFAGFTGKDDDDFVDRLSSRYSVMLLLAFAGILTIYQAMGNIITCWAPVHFTENHINYVNSYCWVKNTYYLPFEEEIPMDHEHDKRHEVTYYQWVPFILLAQALLFILPSIFWHGFNQVGGTDSDNILAAAHTLTKIDKTEQRDHTITIITNQIHRFVHTRRRPAKSGVKAYFKSCGRRFGSYLTILFLFSKLLYIANAFFQLFALERILNVPALEPGFGVMRTVENDYDWHNAPSTTFPKVTMCDFVVRRLGNNHRYTVQCALKLNLWNEKMYTFLWAWLVFVAIVSVVGFLQWLLRSMIFSDRVKFIQNHLNLPPPSIDPSWKDKSFSSPQIEALNEFVNDYLRQDGAFVLRLVAHNTNHITTADITRRLWDKYIADRSVLDELVDDLVCGDDKSTTSQ